MAKSVKSKLSPGQAKLASFGIQLPEFPITLVGSLPKTDELIELRYKVSKGVVPKAELDRKEKLAIEIWVREQERVGVDVLVNGEINRGDFISFFSDKIKGFSPGGKVRVYGNRYYRKPRIIGKLESTGPMTVPMWQFSQRITRKPMKAILTGPYTLMDWSFNEYYSSRAAIIEDLAQIIRNEVKALSDAGAKIIQIDEPAMSSNPAEFPLILSALKKITEGIKAYFILHHEYDDITPIWSKLNQLPVDNLDLETTNSRFSVLPLLRKRPLKKDISFGIIESHNHTIDTPRDINDRIRQVRKVAKASQIWFSPDSGLKTRSVEEASAKIRALTTAVQKIR